MTPATGATLLTFRVSRFRLLKPSAFGRLLEYLSLAGQPAAGASRERKEEVSAKNAIDDQSPSALWVLASATNTFG